MFTELTMTMDDVIRFNNSDACRVAKGGLGGILLAMGLGRLVGRRPGAVMTLILGGVLAGKALADVSLLNVLLGYPADGEAARDQVG
ncbi:MAG TPA: hypothetical protein VFC82_11830 [Actinomycetaceae bacterium]|nr:hypothetical protein [Actinomycetaceae bacterium]